MTRSPEELAELEQRYQHALPPSFYPEAEQSKHLVWYGTNGKPFPAYLNDMWVLCRRCDSEGLKDSQIRYQLFEKHLLEVHALSPRDYSHRYETMEFPVWSE